MHWNGIQKTYLLSYCTSKSEQAKNSLVLPTDLETVTPDPISSIPDLPCSLGYTNSLDGGDYLQRWTLRDDQVAGYK